MPIPKPKKGESRDDFISRCHSAMADEFPDEDQRNAVCFDAWRERNSVRQLTSFRAQTGAVRTETFKDVEHIVIPVTALVEGVMQAENAPGPELVEEVVFSRTATSWNGRPTVVNHPRRNGELVSANSPDVLEAEQIGTIFGSEVKDGKLVMEAWIDRSLISDDADEDAHRRDVIDRAAEGETVEVSIGAFVDVEQREGELNGRAFSARWINIVPDHLAILEEGKIGACSIEDGCGTNRAACGPGCNCARAGGDPEKLVERIVRSFRTAPSEAVTMLATLARRISGAELSDVDKRALLEATLENKHRSDWIFVVAVFEERVVYARQGKLFQREYSIKDDRVVSFGDDVVEVTPRTDFVVVEEEEKERNMEKAERVAGLIKNPKTRFGEEHKEWLLAMEDEQLELLEPEPEPAVAAPQPDPEPAADPDPEPDPEKTPKAKTAEQYLEGAPPEVRSVLSEGLRLQRERKAHFVKALSENPRNGFSPEELEAKDIRELERLAKLADLPDYSARSASSISEPEDDPWKAPPMPKVFEIGGARKAS